MNEIGFTRRQSLIGGAALGLLPSCVTASQERAPLLWEKLAAEPYDGKQDDIAFASDRRGWYGNGKGLIYRTDDGGDSWARVCEKPGTFVRALGFWNENEGVFGNVGIGSFPGVSDPVPLYWTEDGGVSWTAASIDGERPQGICAIEIVRAPFIDRGERAERLTIHAAGRVGGPAHYLRSLDRGRSWSSTNLGALTAAIFDVKFISPSIGFLAGSSDGDLARARGLILRTDDGGASWREVFRSTRDVETVWKLHFPSTSVGFGTIQSYDSDPANVQRFVAKTTDGGRSWKEMPLVRNARWRSFGVGFASETLGWVGGNIGGLETRDGGTTWSPVEMGQAVNKIRFVGEGGRRRAFAIGTGVYRLDLPPAFANATMRDLRLL
ncbi:WD40/YVTN/BNR-like repeat-containing protein [Allosphingosinicella indica]|uniref:Photosynthesis system II assembly factor Ycf48/Hcf136-like domain-containing protein n=1 Tax=Allosphingosinicella indica TaxID=941907 RepID=A0A1X7FYH7_9SPHN|nr:hypothetical protein [Allosphingosinicella indica]SMF61125.1 Uncharacterized protein SAMN06295910_0134 [Allosphingosinicella indica]